MPTGPSSLTPESSGLTAASLYLPLWKHLEGTETGPSAWRDLPHYMSFTPAGKLRGVKCKLSGCF